MKNNTILLILSIMFLLFSTNLFFISFHNIDICQNGLRFQEIVHQKTGIFVEIRELDINLTEQMLIECYLKGLKWSINSIYLTIASSLLLGYAISKKDSDT